MSRRACRKRAFAQVMRITDQLVGAERSLTSSNDRQHVIRVSCFVRNLT